MMTLHRQRQMSSIYTVAGLLAEQGRSLHDQKSLHDAIGQYEFLRREYPESRYRFSALLNEGEIYKDDLNDHDSAKDAFQKLVKSAPQSEAALRARQELKAMRFGADTEKYQHVAAMKHEPLPPARTVTAPSRRSSTVLTAAVQSQQEQVARQALENTPAIKPAPATRTPAAEVQHTDEPAGASVQENRTVPAAVTNFRPQRRERMPLVTGIRHWSTPVYTRVAIDLQDEVEYEASRVPDPDRIFFDLHGARLSPELIGKSVEVIDDGFLKRIRAAQFSNDVTRIVLDVSDVSDYSAFLLPNPYRLIIDIHGRKPGTQQAKIERAPAATVPAPNPASSALTPPHNPPIQAPSTTAGVRPQTPQPAGHTAAPATDIATLGSQPNRVKATAHPTTAPIAATVAGTTPAPQPDAASSVSRRKAKASIVADDASEASHEADPTAAGSRSMVRALGLKIGRIVVDAGHGGHDSGTLGPDGIEEKDVVLDVALRLGKLLHQRLGADVIYTRDDDTFIPLETRTAIANKAQADLFISIHANSSSDPSARGVETYYLNFTASPESLELAARENAVSQQSIHQLSDLVKKIALHDKIDESREFAADVDKYLYEGLDDGNPGLKDRGVKQAPFVVLIGANMPSILAEVSFLTNPDDARELREPKYKQRIAESLYRGIARYVGGLSGVRLAENARQPGGE